MVERAPGRYATHPASERVTSLAVERPRKPAAPEFSTKLVSTAVHNGLLVSLDTGHKLIVDDDLPAPWVESFVDLARELEERRNNRPLKTLIVMSAQRGEGRTLTAANLALALSERLGRRVLLIDGDVEKPSIRRLFNLASTFRLSDIAQPGTREIPVVDVSPTLSVLGTEASQFDAMAVLVSTAMSGVLQAASQYDWVLLDTPPLQSLQEPHLLTWMGDGVLLVIGARTTPRHAVEMAVGELGGDRIVGVVLNRA
jgi:Mrp family chromosome partitioning ATPase